ncbi:hypothetical protein [Sphingopyxis sp. KK2]|uniref:hypothetical protein n=1 Tax=Sphingopyxis sp. KK2 TaxID=1855727 RepID=UPI00097E56CD|nr:hypothetical protein [Sphingopyxis sp. KK2]
MSVVHENGVIRLVGRCAADDAETLLNLLVDETDATIDASDVSKLHLAVAQLLLACAPRIRNLPADPMLAQLFGRRSAER